MTNNHDKVSWHAMTRPEILFHFSNPRCWFVGRTRHSLCESIKILEKVERIWCINNGKNAISHCSPLSTVCTPFHLFNGTATGAPVRFRTPNKEKCDGLSAGKIL